MPRPQSGWMAARLRRRWSMLALAGAIAACGDPQRPEYTTDGPAADTLPPQVQIVAPAESVFSPGEAITIQVEVRDDVRVQAVTASMSGDVSFGWPAVFPGDTFAFVEYSLSTAGIIAGDLTFLAVAFDTADNRGSALRQFYVR